jgi:magnesium transporter
MVAGVVRSGSRRGDEMIFRYDITSSGITASESSAASLTVFAAPSDAEKTEIIESLGLDEYNLASSLDPDEVSRLEMLGERLFLIWKAPETIHVAETIELGVRSMGAVLGADHLAFVFATGDLSFREREYHGVKNQRDVLLRFLLGSIRHYVGHLRVIKQLSASIEKKITVSMENRHLLQMFELTESLVYYVNSIESNALVLTKLRSAAPQLGFDAAQLQLLDDIVLENEQAARQANIYSSVLSGLMDARGTIVNNNMNVLLKNLTLINIIFLPLNLIASIGGMSEWSMMTAGLDWRVSYAIFTAGMVLVGWATWVLVNRVIDRASKGT